MMAGVSTSENGTTFVRVVSFIVRIFMSLKSIRTFVQAVLRFSTAFAETYFDASRVIISLANNISSFGSHERIICFCFSINHIIL